MSGLNGRTFNAGAAIQAKFRFERQDDNDDLTGAAIALRLFTSSSAASPALTLSVGSGIEVETDSASEQLFKVTLTSTQATTLLDGATRQLISYVFAITPSGGNPTRSDDASTYSGAFTIQAEALGGR